MKEIRVVIADDHPIVRQGLAQVIQSDRQLNVVAQASDGAAALACIRDLQPDVAVLDLDMPQMDGLTVARELRRGGWGGALIFLTVHSGADVFREALAVGAKGYVLKDSAVSEIINSIKSVAGGVPYFTPVLVNHLLPNATPASGQLASLTPTERRVLRLLAGYKTNKEIAATLGVSPSTVKNHRTNIAAKLDLHGSHTLLKFAQAHHTELEVTSDG